MALQDIPRAEKLVGSIPSGYKSGDGDRELMIVEPLIKHPELKDTVRAVDPITGWKGWVPYNAPSKPRVEPVTPTQEEENEKLAQKAIKDIRKARELVELGIATEDELNLQEKINIVRTLKGL